MSTNLTGIIKDIVDKYGEDVLYDPRRMFSFFTDFANNEPKPLKNVFIKCLENGYVKILKNTDETELEQCKQRLTKKLSDEEGFDIVLCGEAVELLINVLNIQQTIVPIRNIESPISKKFVIEPTTNSQIDTSNTILEKQGEIKKHNDSSSLPFAILSCLFPIIGLILFFVWRKNRPQKAKSCGIGTVIGLIIGVTLAVIKNVILEGERISTNNFTKEGLTFSYPNKWKIEFEVLEANTMFFASCENPNTSDIVIIIWTNSGTTSPEELIENIIEEYKTQFKYSEFSSLYYSYFKYHLECLTMDFSAIYSFFASPDEKVYGRISSFIMNGYTVLVVKQSDTEDKLLTKPFQLIEESIYLY
jgi:hypothetical protein